MKNYFFDIMFQIQHNFLNIKRLPIRYYLITNLSSQGKDYNPRFSILVKNIIAILI